MATPLDASLSELTGIQRQAVDWGDGPLLVLAGPGAGKTRVLTCRIAQLLDASKGQRFRVLALTFTNKAANEMASRVATLASRPSGRAHIDTFHGFCAQVLRQHGVHLGIKPDFAIFSRTADRRAVLEDALRRNRAKASLDDMRLLPLIDSLKAWLVEPEHALRHVRGMRSPPTEDVSRIGHVYRLYEQELRRSNALDFNSLIFEAYRLFGYSVMAKHYRTVYRYWMIDEFQDTNGAQYALLRRMAGSGFRNVFAVADDDQTIFEWNGANVRRIDQLERDFSCAVQRLPTNFRCPPRIVDAANRLVVHNVVRARTKQSATAARRSSCFSDGAQIGCRVFDADRDEATGIAKEIRLLNVAARGRTAVLARTRGLLELMADSLAATGTPARITGRRDDFVSPQMRWLVACLKQVSRPMDQRNMAMLVEVFNDFAQIRLDSQDLASRSATDGVTYLTCWLDAVRRLDLAGPTLDMVDAVAHLARGGQWAHAVQKVLTLLEPSDAEEDGGGHEDIREDLSAWRRISREIRTARGATSLDEFLQELQLRSKEPIPVPGTVSLATIHRAKGLEFDIVYLIGLAEGILPSWHSMQKGSGSAAIEEERRSCFVAITRTRRRLILSRAKHYRGWPKEPSRFLGEMGCVCSVPPPMDKSQTSRHPPVTGGR